MSKFRHTAPDWPALIGQLGDHNMTLEAISKAVGFFITARMLAYYKAGKQPLYHRGEPLIDLWCLTLGKTREDLPRLPVRFPYRVPYAVRQRAATALPLSLFPLRLAEDAPAEPVVMPVAVVVAPVEEAKAKRKYTKRDKAVA
jgi:hypothetical protein